ncbi:hypothetical protein ACHAWF_009873 [Thalassiosira exigua]
MRRNRQPLDLRRGSPDLLDRSDGDDGAVAVVGTVSKRTNPRRRRKYPISSSSGSRRPPASLPPLGVPSQPVPLLLAPSA